MTFFKKLTLVLAVSITYALHCPPIEIAKFSDVWDFEEACTVKYGNVELTVSSSRGYAEDEILEEVLSNSIPCWRVKSLGCINLPSLEKKDHRSLPLLKNYSDDSYKLETVFLIDNDNTLLGHSSSGDMHCLIDPSSDEAKTAWAEIDAGAELTILESAEGK